MSSKQNPCKKRLKASARRSLDATIGRQEGIPVYGRIPKTTAKIKASQWKNPRKRRNPVSKSGGGGGLIVIAAIGLGIIIFMKSWDK